MLLKRILNSAAAATLVSASALHNHEKLHDLKPREYNGGCVEHHITSVNVLYPILINQYFSHNQSIVINGGIKVNINNAPAFLSTILTGTSTSTSTGTINATANPTSTASGTITSTSTPQVGQFNLKLSTPGNTKREDSDILYVGPSGATVSGCSFGIVYSLSADGQLSSTEGIISTDPDIPSQIFASLSTTLGSINTGFSFKGGSLQWADASFDNGEARFCLLGTIVRVDFVGADSSCTPIDLIMTPASNCGSSAATSSASLGPSAVTSSPSSATSAPTTDDPFISGMLTWHNLYRANNGASPLVWDTTLATFAKSTSDSCVFAHTGGPYGENLAEGSMTNPNYFVYSWYDELNNYKFANPDTSTFSTWGHFSQVVWKATTTVGCGYTTGCTGGNYLVCEYSPAGNDLTPQELAANVGPPTSMNFAIPPMN